MYSDDDGQDNSDDDENNESQEVLWTLEKEKWRHSMLPPSDNLTNIRPWKRHCFAGLNAKCEVDEICCNTTTMYSKQPPDQENQYEVH